MQFKTHSGCPFNSAEQRKYFEEERNNCMKGIEQYCSDPEFYKLPFFNVYKDYKTWQKFDFIDVIPQITPMQLFLNNYKEFMKNTHDLKYVCKSKLACNDISQEEHDFIMKELELRELFMESQLDLKKKKSFYNIFKNETEKNQFFERLGDSVAYCAKAHTSTSSISTESSSNQIDV